MLGDFHSYFILTKSKIGTLNICSTVSKNNAINFLKFCGLDDQTISFQLCRKSTRLIMMEIYWKFMVMFFWLGGSHVEAWNKESLIRLYSICSCWSGGRTTVQSPGATVWRSGVWWFFCWRGSWTACHSAFWFVTWWFYWWWWSGRLPLLVATWSYFWIFLWREIFGEPFSRAEKDVLFYSLFYWKLKFCFSILKINCKVSVTWKSIILVPIEMYWKSKVYLT